MNRKKAREQLFLFEFEKTFECNTLEEILEMAKVSRNIEISDFAKKSFCAINENEEKIDKIIEENIVGWKKDRLSKATLSILRIAVYEMMFEESIPNGVSINEAVELSKTYSTKEDASFVNGVLASVNRKLEKIDG